MNPKGYVLLEVLVASVILSLAGSELCSGIIQAIKVEKKIHEMNAAYDPFRVVCVRVENDLRNAADLRRFPFKGKENEIELPVLISEVKQETQDPEIWQVRYFLKGNDLVRSEQSINTGNSGNDSRPVLKQIKSLHFSFAYLDEHENSVFRPVWSDSPYFGIPKAVILDIELKNGGQKFQKLIEIPQGKWGRITHE